MQSFCEQKPAHRVRPLLMTINFPSLIGPYVLHFKQNPLTSAIGTDSPYHHILMKPLFHNQIQFFYILPLIPPPLKGIFAFFALFSEKRIAAPNIKSSLQVPCRIMCVMRHYVSH